MCVEPWSMEGLNPRPQSHGSQHVTATWRCFFHESLCGRLGNKASFAPARATMEKARRLRHTRAGTGTQLLRRHT